MEVLDLKGQKFGRLAVSKRAGSDNRGEALWLCECECGKTTTIRGSFLRRGISKSCGCLQKELLAKRSIGKKNPMWAGDSVSKTGAHMWLAENKPIPEFCERCRERPARELSYNCKNGEWSRDPNDYEWLCHSCHCFKDKGSNTIMTRARIHRIREFYRIGAATQQELSKMFKVSRTLIYYIVNQIKNYAVPA